MGVVAPAVGKALERGVEPTAALAAEQDRVRREQTGGGSEQP